MSLKHTYTRIFGAFVAASLWAGAPAGAALQSPPPSLQDFSLEPDDDPAEEPPSRVQGPVADGQRPRDLSQPAQQPQTQPQRQQPATGSNTAPATVQPVPQTQRPAAQDTQQRPAQSGTLEQQNAPATSILPGTANDAANDNDASDAAEAPAAVPATDGDTAPQLDMPAASADSDGSSSNLWLWIALAVAALGAAAFVMLRRRSAAQSAGYESTGQSAREPLQPSPPVNLRGNTGPVPQPKAAPRTAPEPAPQPAADDRGFVTSSLRADPQPVPVSKGPPPSRPAQPQAVPYTPAPAASNSVGDMRVEFIAETAGSTMMNAVLGYRIALYNEGGIDMSNIALHGTMVQASGGENELDIQMQPLHEIGAIAAGKAHEVKGEIRVPLAGIKPIEFNNQALFVPVARFLIEYDDADGKTHREHHAFIIGREHQPPREKMAPFRLDQGPGNFRPVGQRVLAV